MLADTRIGIATGFSDAGQRRTGGDISGPQFCPGHALWADTTGPGGNAVPSRDVRTEQPNVEQNSQ